MYWICAIISLLLSSVTSLRATTPLIDSLLISTPIKQQIEFDEILPEGLPLIDYNALNELPHNQLPLPLEQAIPPIRPEIFRQGRIIIEPVTQVLYLAPRFVFSNGQAQNWSVYPSGYIDARTISMPVP